MSKTVKRDGSAGLLKIEQREIAQLRPWATNPKTHEQKQIRAIARSISEHGFINPILVDEREAIIAGHGRFAAAQLLGLSSVPVIVLRHLSEVQKRAYRIADNRLAEIGTGWSIENLQIEIDAILSVDPSFHLELTGFSADELSLKFDGAANREEGDEPAIPEVGTAAVSKIGDVWYVGEHALICGDATDPATYHQLLGRDRPVMVFADPPYNVRINGHVTGKGKAKHREFVAASGEMSDAEFQKFLLDFMTASARFCQAGTLHYLCMDWAHLWHLLAAGRIAYDELKNICVWTKANAGMGSLYRSQHEFVAVFKSGKAPHINNVELGKHGRNRSNVWPYAGMNSFASGRDEALAMHPTVKPIALVRDAILDASNRDDLVLDPFGGSGTTLLAADAVRRRARLIELDPLYCDVILKRAEQSLGISATLAATGQTFAGVAAERETING